MLRFLLRTIGLVALAGAFAAAVMDGARSIANGALSLTPLGLTIGRLAPSKLAALPGLAARVSPKLWDPVLIHLLWVPTSVALAAVGFALAMLAAPRRR